MNRERENWGCSEREREERLEEGKPCHVPPRALFPSTQPPRAFLKGAVEGPLRRRVPRLN